MLSKDNITKIEDLKARYPTTKALVLPALWIAQGQEGFISEDMMKEIAELLDIPFAHVLGVVTFYTMFHIKPIGKRHVEVCTNVSCMLRGSAQIVEHLEKRLGIPLGSTSEDGAWTLSEVECMGSCGTAPMFAVGEEYYENLTPEKVDGIVDGLK
jgi:NADH-quinone oxidoreductase E subunit